MEILLGVLASLAGVIVGGVLQHITSQRNLKLQHAWDRSRLVHEKLELIAQVSMEVSLALSSTYLSAIDSIENGVRFKSDSNIPFAKLEMLIDFYAPELKNEYKKIIVLRDDMATILADLITDRLPTVKSEKQTLNGKFMMAIFNVSKICEDLTAEASKISRKSLALR